MDEKYISLIASYLSGDLAAEEREVLFELVNSSKEHKAYFEEMQNLWELTDIEEEEAFVVDTDIAWQKVEQRISTDAKEAIVPEKTAKRFQIGQLLKIAAIFIGVLGAFWFFNRSGDIEGQLAMYETMSQERKEITLPDGSTVWLNENSKLSFEENFAPRLVNLEGEAFFDVKHLDKEHKFEIKSGDTKTTVLGTSFNVRAYPEEDQVEVTVETGKVVFEKEKIQKTEKKVVLTAGESGVYKKKEVEVTKTKQTISNADAWKTKELIFDDDAKIEEWVEVMERYFDVEIKVENKKILDCPQKGTFTNPNLDDIVKTIQFSIGIEINQNENTLTFSGEGCE